MPRNKCPAYLGNIATTTLRSSLTAGHLFLWITLNKKMGCEKTSSLHLNPGLQDFAWLKPKRFTLFEGIKNTWLFFVLSLLATASFRQAIAQRCHPPTLGALPFIMGTQNHRQTHLNL
ncbi:MAG: hypothetical protein PUP93_10460 [Rhizonema sp. NSF051]|nr:hypothetical protein [Rhizonema sp. NSF051]